MAAVAAVAVVTAAVAAVATAVVIAVVVVVAAVAAVAVVEKKVLSHPAMGGVILRLGALTEPWESEKMLEDLRRS